MVFFYAEVLLLFLFILRILFLLKVFLTLGPPTLKNNSLPLLHFAQINNVLLAYFECLRQLLTFLEKG